MKIAILGAGRQGKIVSKDLLRQGFDITTFDINDPQLNSADFIKCDLSNITEIKKNIKRFDIVVCALPAKLGFSTIRACIECGKNCIDLSYCGENILELNDLAVKNGIVVIPDCGVAPGLSNLVAGRALYKLAPNKVSIQVGGFSKDPLAPLGYALTWSPDDLLDEFIRPARIIENRQVAVKDALSGREVFEVDGVGKLESFYTDGLRTMLYNFGCANVVEEKTIRRYGTLDETIALMKEEKFLEFVGDNCSGIEDILVMRITADARTETIVVEGKDGISAMARSTAFSCSAFTQLLADGFIDKSGVIPPEVISKDDDSYSYLLDLLRLNGIEFKSTYPFWT